jgi:hypothetical protein
MQRGADKHRGDDRGRKARRSQTANSPDNLNGVDLIGNDAMNTNSGT